MPAKFPSGAQIVLILATIGASAGASGPGSLPGEPALPALGAQRGGAAGLGLKLFHPAATEHAGSAIQGIPSLIWGLPLPQ